jgi:hypothetical protein
MRLFAVTGVNFVLPFYIKIQIQFCQLAAAYCSDAVTMHNTAVSWQTSRQIHDHQLTNSFPMNTVIYSS